MSNISIHIEQGNMFDFMNYIFLLWQYRVPPIGLFHRYMTVCKLVLVMTIVVAEILVLLT